MSDTVYSEKELKKIQDLEKSALSVIDRICNNNGIEYFLIGGTALGAYRHNGFIPWDDDIDVGMTREHYKKFLRIAPEELEEGYFLQTPYNGENNPYFYSKLRIDGTQFVEYCNRNLDIHHGVYVDIFPFDEVPDDEGLNKRHFNEVQRLIRVFSLRQIPDVSSKPKSISQKLKSMLRKGFRFFTKAIPYGFLCNKIELEMTKYNGTGQHALACLNFPKRKTEYILSSDLYPLQYHPFENMECPIPQNIDKYLKTHYGDYMRLPPENERIGHKPFVVDLGT